MRRPSLNTDLKLTSFLAYRRIPKGKTGKYKSNVCFAREAFDAIRQLGECYAISMDISSFFDCIDHERLRSAWAGLLGKVALPPDHFAVFKAATNYSYADKRKVFEALGLIGPVVGPNGSTSIGYTKKRKEMPIKLCNSKDFQSKIVPLVKKNKECFGIPQGLPISDVLSNLALLEFDQEAKAIVSGHGGMYLRYSDDILILVPNLNTDFAAIEKQVIALIKKSGPKLQIQPAKCCVHRFQPMQRGSCA